MLKKSLMFSAAQQDMTYLSMVRTDPSQIKQLLEQRFNEISAKDVTIAQVPITEAYDVYFNQCKQFLFGQINHQAVAEEIKKSSAGGKGVCAKTLHHGNVAWKCETCEKDPTCIICQECFELGDHKGHKVFLKRNVSGCCDCGDPDAWQEEGFCKKHKGYSASSEVLLEQLPLFIKRSAKYVLDHVCLKLKTACMELGVYQRMKDTAYKGFVTPDNKKKELKCTLVIGALLDFIDWVVDVSPAFIHFLTDSMGEIFLTEIRQKDRETLIENYQGLGLQPSKLGLKQGEEPERMHECCTRAFINEHEKSVFSKALTQFIIDEDGPDSIFLNQSTTGLQSEGATEEEQVPVVNFTEEIFEKVREAKGICTCTVLDLTFMINHVITDSMRKVMHELYFKMFQSFKFKQYLGLSFAANIVIIQTQNDRVKNRIGSIGVQLLTIEEISLMIMQNTNLRENLLDAYETAMDNMIENDFLESDQNVVYQLLYDFKYMARTKTLNYTIAHTNFVERLLMKLTQLYYLDTLELKTQHVMFDNNILKEGLINMEVFFVKTFKSFLKAVDPTDVQRNKSLMRTFLTQFEEIQEKMPKEGTRGFFALPLHHLFSYYLSRLIMHNYFSNMVTFKKSKKELFMTIMLRYIDTPPGKNHWRHTQELLEMILQPLARSWAFLHEVMSGKWVMSGLFISHLAQVHYKVYEYYLLANVGLFQIVLAVSPEPQRIIEQIMGGFTCDAWMKKLHEKLLEPVITEEQPQPFIDLQAKDFTQYAAIFDEKKLRQLLHWELRLLTQLCVTEAGFMFPLLTNLSQKENLTFPIKSANTMAIEMLYKADTQRSIVHALVLLGGRADFKQLKKQMETSDIYTESENFEEELLAVTTQSKDVSGKKVIFKLKEEQYLSWFEPYFYLIPESQPKVHEVLQGVYQEKKLVNEILGDYTGSYSYHTHVNSLIQHALTQSPMLIKILTSVLRLWCTNPKPAQLKVVDDQIAYEALKLLFVIAKNSDEKHRDFLVKVVKEGDYSLAKALRDKGASQPGSVLDKALKEVFIVLFGVDKQSLPFLGEVLGVAESTQMSGEQFSQPLPIAAGEDSKKQQARLKQEAILQRFKTKRQDFMDKQSTTGSGPQTPSLQSSRSMVDSSQTQEDDEEVECSLCKEPLSHEHSYSQPYGQFGYVGTSKMLYHAYKQTLDETSAPSSQVEESKTEGAGEIKQSASPIESLGDVACLEYLHGTGGTFTKCSHYAHFSCLTNYLTANEGDQQKRNMRKIIGFDFDTFQCPLCKHIANVLLPCDTLGGYAEMKLYQKDFKPYELAEFHTRLIAKVVQKQTQSKKEILPVDLKKDPIAILTAVGNFIEHRIQLTEIKGVNEFLGAKGLKKQASDHNRVGKEQYADILEITRSVVSLIHEGEIQVAQHTAIEDHDMTECSFEALCLHEMSKVLELRKGWRLLESDFSSVAIQLMYFSTLAYSQCLPLLQQCLDAISRSVFSIFQLQTLIKALFTKEKLTTQQAVLRGTPSQLFEALANYQGIMKLGGSEPTPQIDADTLQKVRELSIIPSQLPFLRKLAAFKVLARTSAMKSAQNVSAFEDYSEIQEEDSKFVKLLSEQFDDAEEHTLLSSYLGLTKAQEESVKLPEELHEVLAYLSSESEQRSALESYALSTVIQLSNPSLSPSSDRLSLQQQLPLHTNALTLQQPARFRLLSGSLRFNLVSLPADFQTLVQTYYKQKCGNCNTQPKESCVCLLCGEIVCFLQKCCVSLPRMKPNEGELSYHARTCEGGNAVYLCTTNGKIIFVDEERSSQKPSPYMNRFGENFSQSSKRWDNYTLQKGAYDELKKLYSDFALSNEVIKERSMSDVVWRLRAI